MYYHSSVFKYGLLRQISPPLKSLYSPPFISSPFSTRGYRYTQAKNTVIQDHLKIKRSEHMHSFYFYFIFFLTVANESWGTHQNHPQSAKFQGTDGGF